jgi:hypothetical protein
MVGATIIDGLINDAVTRLFATATELLNVHWRLAPAVERAGKRSCVALSSCLVIRGSVRSIRFELRAFTVDQSVKLAKTIGIDDVG